MLGSVYPCLDANLDVPHERPFNPLLHEGFPGHNPASLDTIFLPEPIVEPPLQGGFSDAPSGNQENFNLESDESSFYSSEDERLESLTAAYIASVCSAISGVSPAGLAEVEPYRMIILYDCKDATINVIYASKRDKAGDYEKVERVWAECKQVVFPHLEPTPVDARGVAAKE
ncbi:hypothetical protein PQX77_012160 [Marasmius sp. AFHP31]|nr:hypothetical protein PQX77_012160 [Marasmius sp. AFHP31]